MLIARIVSTGSVIVISPIMLLFLRLPFPGMVIKIRFAHTSHRKH